jgi:uncharacterized membrane protein
MNEPLNNPDKYKWGFLYFDPKDSRVFVPKSVNWMGYTINFGNPIAYMVLATLITLVIFASTLGK